MHTDKDTNNKISIHDLDTTDAELLQSAVLRLAEQTDDTDHSRRLRKIAMTIDKVIR